MKGKNALDFCSFLIANFSVTRISYNNHELKGGKKAAPVSCETKMSKSCTLSAVGQSSDIFSNVHCPYGSIIFCQASVCLYCIIDLVKFDIIGFWPDLKF